MHTGVFSKCIKLCLFLGVDDDGGILKFISLDQNIMRIFGHSKASVEK